jgi:hypothetical protein
LWQQPKSTKNFIKLVIRLKVIEYIEHLRDKINRNECIYCEKIFTDRITLMDHMRKKNHKEVNPKNNYYDKVFLFEFFNFLFSFILLIIWNLVNVGLMFWLRILRFYCFTLLCCNLCFRTQCHHFWTQMMKKKIRGKNLKFFTFFYIKELNFLSKIIWMKIYLVCVCFAILQTLN